MLTDEQRDKLLANRPARTVTEQSIKDRIVSREFLRPESDSTLTICVVTLVNGFQFVGHSACAIKENFNQELGEKIAFDNAFRQVWSHEGYLLRQETWESETPEHNPGEQATS